MYNENFKFSERHLRETKAYTEAMIADFNARAAVPAPTKSSAFAFDNESRMVVEQTGARDALDARYQSFSNTVRSSLLIEAVYKIFKEAMDPNKLDNTTTSIMRAMVSEYVTENGYFEIMSRMKSASPTTIAIYNTITNSHRSIMESVDKDNPETFRIAPEMRDEFFKQLDYSDSQAVSDAINQRVGDAMTDFIDANKKDHEDITGVLQQAQEKIGDVAPEDDSLKESYTRIATGKTNEIRNRPKSVLHAMVHTMCETVMRKPDMHAEFMSEGKLDVPKIVDRIRVMYTFMETLNTSKIERVNEAFINGVIRDLSI